MGKKTHEQFVNEMTHINPNIKILGIYTTARNSLLCACLVDGYQWNPTPDSLLCGKGCPKCAGNIKKTHNEFQEELSIINPNIYVIEQYKNNKTPIRVRCLIHNFEYMSTPTKLLKGTSACIYCQKESKTYNPVKTHDAFVTKLSQINPNITVLGKYQKSSIPILCQCNNDNHKWRATPSSLLSGSGCPVCAKIKVANKPSDIRFRVMNDFQCYDNLVWIGDDSEYKSRESKITLQDKNGYMYYLSFNRLSKNKKRQSELAKYGYSNPYTIQNINNFIKQNDRNFELLSTTFINAHDKLDFFCKKHNIVFQHTWNAIDTGCGCPLCRYEMSGESIRKTHEEFVQQIHDLYLGEYEVVDKYITTYTPIAFRHKICDNVFQAKPAYMLQMETSCPNCNICSQGEARILHLLKTHCVNFKQQYVFDDLIGLGGCKLRYDFMILNDNNKPYCAIEFHGQQHYKPQKFFGGIEGYNKLKQHDALKKEYCQNHNIQLIEVSFEEIDNIQNILIKNNILKQ